MRFVPDEEAEIWLNDFIPESDYFDWDQGNNQKNLKHGFSINDIESIFDQQRFVFLGKIIDPQHNEWRGLVVGRTQRGDLATLIYTRRGEKLRPISCRPARLNERKIYEEEIDE